jgi:hypothetical protein
MIVLVGHVCVAQVPTIDLYQYNYASVAPVFAGVDGARVTFMGSVMNPGSRDAGFLGIEATFKKINSGVAFNVSAQSQSPVTGTFYNLSYNYRWSIDEDRKLIFGGKVGLSEHIVDRSAYVPIDPNDPLLNGRGLVGYTRPMAGLGVLYKTDVFFGGISAENLLREERLNNPNINFRSDRILVHYFVGVNTGRGKSFSTTHSIYAMTNGNDLWRADFNSSVKVWWLITGVSFQIDDHNDILPKVNAGVSIKDKAKIMVMVYSKARDIDKSFSGQLLLQFSL